MIDDVVVRLVACVRRGDVASAAGIVLDALENGLVSDADDLLAYVDDDDAREIVRLELETMIEAALGASVAGVQDAWR